ncbi:MAG: isoprenylcysteine carboxylmethyltransferase family protein [Candidatus Lokiarchaeota archaeon]|nr:isoprenylcysteine carboxylmethyltransferase family protein [Candidatus Lokiarchaeota archaeon]
MVEFENEEFIFRMILIGIYSIFTIIRIRYRRIAKNNGVIKEKDNATQKLLFAMMAYEVLTFIAFVFLYNWIPWEIAHIPFPLWLRWMGLPLGLGAIVYFIIVHEALGKNFSPKLRIKKEQTLITHGPYKHIRHPMYVAFFLLHLAVFFIVANWIIGISWNIFLFTIIAIRVKPEEKLMIERFGKEYEEYIERTRRFLPIKKKTRI